MVNVCVVAGSRDPGEAIELEEPRKLGMQNVTRSYWDTQSKTPHALSHQKMTLKEAGQGQR